MTSVNLKESAAVSRGQRLRESNVKAWDRQQGTVLESMRKMIDTQYGVDITEGEISELLDFSSPDFSIKGFRESVYKFCRTIREANAESALQQLLRAGVQLAVNKEYQAVDTTFEELVNVIPSNKAIELYAPLYRSGYPAPIEGGDEPPRINASGADFQLRNRKFAAIFEVTEEILEDDQTNQVQEQAQQIGENAKILKDSRVFVRWLGAAGVDAGGNAVPAAQLASQAGESTWPYNTAFTNGGGKNRLTSYTAFTFQTVIQLRQLARQMKDPKGNKMLVNPDTLVHGSGLVDAVLEMLGSEFYPSTSAISATGTLSGGSAASTTTALGTTYARNILKGKYNPVSSVWLPDTAYGIYQAGKGLRFQQRRALRVQQENAASGPAFTCGVFRYKIDERYEVDWTEPRFSILGSDGTV